jgi:hypothetical protein
MEPSFHFTKKMLAAVFVVAFFVSVPVLVLAADGTSYTIDPASNVFSTHTKVSGTSYVIDGSVDPIAGNDSGTSYTVESGDGFEFYCGDGFVDTGEDCEGSDLNSGTCVTEGFASGTLSCSSCSFDTSSCEAAAATSSGGGGSARAVSKTESDAATTKTILKPLVSEEVRKTVFSYGNSIVLSGTKETTALEVIVNGSSVNVDYPTNTSWKVLVSLSYGINNFKAVSKYSNEMSGETTYAIFRRIPGDITADGKVDDYDLSKLSQIWGGESRDGDFNEDNAVNDYDFSMMVARWGTIVPIL